MFRDGSCFQPCVRIPCAVEDEIRAFLSAYKQEVGNCPGGCQRCADASVSDMYPCYREHAKEEKIAFLQEECYRTVSPLMGKGSIKGHMIAAHIRIVRNLS